MSLAIHLQLPRRVKTPHPTPKGTPRLACGAERRIWTELRHTSDPETTRVTCGKCLREGRRLGLIKPQVKKEPSAQQLFTKEVASVARQVRGQNVSFIAKFKNLIGE